jgi:AhpD family alkylhydroperoxidase
MANSENGLASYFILAASKNSLKDKEVIKLVVSQVINCQYCLAAHTAIAKVNDFTINKFCKYEGAEQVSISDRCPVQICKRC